MYKRAWLKMYPDENRNYDNINHRVVGITITNFTKFCSHTEKWQKLPNWYTIFAPSSSAFNATVRVILSPFYTSR